MTPLPREKQNLEINFLEDLLKDRHSVQHVSMEERQELREDQLQRAASSGALDEDLLFGSDSDDSFAKDYTITRNTLRKERIVKRDIAVLNKEKKKREQDQLYKAEMEKLEAEELRRSQAIAEKQALSDALIR